MSINIYRACVRACVRVCVRVCVCVCVCVCVEVELNFIKQSSKWLYSNLLYEKLNYPLFEINKLKFLAPIVPLNYSRVLTRMPRYKIYANIHTSP